LDSAHRRRSVVAQVAASAGDEQQGGPSRALEVELMPFARAQALQTPLSGNGISRTFAIRRRFFFAQPSLGRALAAAPSDGLAAARAALAAAALFGSSASRATACSSVTAMGRSRPVTLGCGAVLDVGAEGRKARARARRSPDGRQGPQRRSSPRGLAPARFFGQQATARLSPTSNTCRAVRWRRFRWLHERPVRRTPRQDRLAVLGCIPTSRGRRSSRRPFYRSMSEADQPWAGWNAWAFAVAQLHHRRRNGRIRKTSCRCPDRRQLAVSGPFRPPQPADRAGVAALRVVRAADERPEAAGLHAEPPVPQVGQTRTSEPSALADREGRQRFVRVSRPHAWSGQDLRSSDELLQNSRNSTFQSRSPAETLSTFFKVAGESYSTPGVRIPRGRSYQAALVLRNERFLSCGRIRGRAARQHEA